MLSWQLHNECYFVSFVMYISSANLNLKNTDLIFVEIFTFFFTWKTSQVSSNYFFFVDIISWVTCLLYQ